MVQERWRPQRQGEEEQVIEPLTNATARENAEMLSFAAMLMYRKANETQDQKVKLTWLGQAEHCSNLAKSYQALAEGR